jgi:hypothetical protein
MSDGYLGHESTYTHRPSAYFANHPLLLNINRLPFGLVTSERWLSSTLSAIPSTLIGD